VTVTVQNVEAKAPSVSENVACTVYVPDEVKVRLIDSWREDVAPKFSPESKAPLIRHSTLLNLEFESNPWAVNDWLSPVLKLTFSEEGNTRLAVGAVLDWVTVTVHDVEAEAPLVSENVVCTV
jgi:hypothetical protein